MLYLREDESIAIEPIWVLWIEGHEFVEQDMGNRCHAHRGARVAGVGSEGGIDLLESEGIIWCSWKGTGHCRVKDWEFGGVGSYRKHSNGVDGQPVSVSVSHDC